MKEIDRKEAPGVAGGYRDNGGGCIPLTPLPIGVTVPGDLVPSDPYPRSPLSPYTDPAEFVTDPPAV